LPLHRKWASDPFFTGLGIAFQYFGDAREDLRIVTEMSRSVGLWG
jgi:hypothetical protein